MKMRNEHIRLGNTRTWEEPWKAGGKDEEEIGNFKILRPTGKKKNDTTEKQFDIVV